MRILPVVMPVSALGVSVVENDCLLARVRAYSGRHRLFSEGGSVWLGLSGGADSSLALAMAVEMGCHPLAVHLHHGLRGVAADADADWCDRLCARLGVPFECHRLEVAARALPGEGLEAAGRRCRLAFWAERARGGTVVLGHHADDALETLLLRLLRGSNVSGAVGLRPLRVLHGVRYTRPLLCLRRLEVETALRQRGISWCDDATNGDESLRRNVVRHRLLPLIREIAGTDAGLLGSLRHLEQDAEYLESESARLAESIQSAADLRDVHPALFPRVVRLWLGRESGQDSVPRGAALERLRAALANSGSGPVRIPFAAGVTVVVHGDRIRLLRPTAPLPQRHWAWRLEPHLPLPPGERRLEARLEDVAVRHPWERDRGAEWFAAAALPAELSVRSWQPGDRMVPFGRHRPVKLKELLAAAGVPRERRDGVPVVAAGETIIWVVGVARSEFGRLPAAGDGAAVRLALVEERD